MAEVEVLVRTIEAKRLSESSADDASVNFDVGATLTESGREAGSLTLKFDIMITAQPPVAKINVGGSARISGEEHDIESMLTSKSPDSTPPIFMTIYQKVYAVLYLLSGSLKIPYPSPALMKVVKVNSPNEVAPVKAEERSTISA
jgi:hypothetical protein